LEEDLVDRAALRLAFDRCPEAVLAAGVGSQHLLIGLEVCVNPAFGGRTALAPKDLDDQLAKLSLSGDMPGTNLSGGRARNLHQLSLRPGSPHKDGGATAAWKQAWLTPKSALHGDWVVFRSQISAWNRGAMDAPTPSTLQCHFVDSAPSSARASGASLLFATVKMQSGSLKPGASNPPPPSLNALMTQRRSPLSKARSGAGTPERRECPDIQRKVRWGKTSMRCGMFPNGRSRRIAMSSSGVTRSS